MDWKLVSLLIVSGALFTNVIVDVLKSSGIRCKVLWRGFALCIPTAAIISIGQLAGWDIVASAGVGFGAGVASILVYDAGFYPIVRDKVKAAGPALVEKLLSRFTGGQS